MGARSTRTVSGVARHSLSAWRIGEDGRFRKLGGRSSSTLAALPAQAHDDRRRALSAEQEKRTRARRVFGAGRVVRCAGGLCFTPAAARARATRQPLAHHSSRRARRELLPLKRIHLAPARSTSPPTADCLWDVFSSRRFLLALPWLLAAARTKTPAPWQQSKHLHVCLARSSPSNYSGHGSTAIQISPEHGNVGLPMAFSLAEPWPLASPHTATPLCLVFQ